MKLSAIHSALVAKRRLFFYLVVIGFIVILSGCGAPTQPIDAQTEGWFNHYFVYTFSSMITYFAQHLDGNYGLAMIIVTVLIRLVLMPLMLKQLKSQTILQAKQKRLQPELQALHEKYKDKAKDPAEQKAKQQEMMQLYQKHQMNPFAIGCLPALVQLPILLGFYYAIQRTPEIASHTFLWFHLGHPDMVLPILVAIVAFIQYKASQIGNRFNEDQPRQMKWLGLLSPALMGLFSFTAPAAIPLYWMVGGLIVIAQTLVGKRLFRSVNL